MTTWLLKPRRGHSLSTADKLGLTLELLAANSPQLIQSDLVQCSQSTISRAFEETIDAIYSEREQFIKWPTDQETAVIKRK